MIKLNEVRKQSTIEKNNFLKIVDNLLKNYFYSPFGDSKEIKKSIYFHFSNIIDDINYNISNNKVVNDKVIQTIINRNLSGQSGFVNKHGVDVSLVYLFFNARRELLKYFPSLENPLTYKGNIAEYISDKQYEFYFTYIYEIYKKVEYTLK